MTRAIDYHSARRLFSAIPPNAGPPPYAFIDYRPADPDDLFVATPLFRTKTNGVSTRLYQWFVAEDDDSGQWRRVSRGDYRRIREGRSL